MKKLLLLTLFSFTFLHLSVAQVDTIFTERFDLPSGADSVTTGSFVDANPPSPGVHPFVISNLYTSPSQSFKGKGVIASGTRYHYVDLDPITTDKYVFLYFNHICKINQLNKARIKVSTDGGQTFQLATSDHYRGASLNFPFNGLNYFNDHSYRTAVGGDPWFAGQHGPAFTPNNSWWVPEAFDLSGLASDTVAGTGYSNVVIRFEFELQFDLSQINQGAPGSTGYGWLLDDIVVTTAGCELEPPVLNWDLQPVPCFFNRPEGDIVARQDETFRIAIAATDRLSGIDEVKLCYKIHRANNTQTSLTCINMQPDVNGNQVGSVKVTNGNDVYYADVPGVGVNDTVYYYVKAWDNSCPNETKSPGLVDFYKFWTEPSLPPMCGQINCSQFPELISVTDKTPDPDGTLWTENFEASRWRAGNNGTTTNQNAHRGEIPDFPDGGWFTSPSLDINFKDEYAWCVGTSALPKAHGSITGPSGNHTQGGNKYMFADFSLNQGTRIATFQTPCIDLTKETRCLAFEFYYHMFGAGLDLGNKSLLRVDIRYSNNPDFPQTNVKRVVGQVQLSESDAWKKMIFSLGPYIGQYVQIRFLAIKRVSDFSGYPAGMQHQGDIAIDDFRIFEPDNNDFEVLEVTSPKNGFCYYTDDEPVTMVVRNNGCQTQTDIPVSFRVNGGTPTYDTIRTNLALGDTLTYTFSEGAKLGAFNPNYVITASTNLPGDIRVGNDSKSSDPIEHINAIGVFPYIEDFENGTPGTQTLGTDKFRTMPGLNDVGFQWRVGREMTPRRYTGPFSGFYYGGNYMYTHTGVNSSVNTGLETYLRTICLDLSSLSSPVLGFYYHMFGSSSMLKLELEVSKADEDLSTWTTIPNSEILPAGQQTKELDDWKFMRVDLSPYQGESIKIRFKAVRTEVVIPPGDPITPAFQSNFAIDKIMVYDEAANDAGVIALSEPVTHVEAGVPFTPKVKVTNYGSSSLNSVPVTVAVTPLCGTNQGQTSTYSGTVNLTSPLLNGTTSTPLSVDGVNINWPEEGEFEICAYTTLTGDNYKFNDTVCRRLTAYGSHYIAWGTDFDTCNYSADGFYLGDNYSASGNVLRSYRQWELGTPGGARINRPQSSPNAWVTNLDGAFLDSSDEFLYVPRLDNFDTIVKAQIRFYQNLDMPTATPLRSSPAAGAIEYKVNNKWKSVGADYIQEEVGSNWYFGNWGALSLDLFDGNPGFVGRSNGNWIYSTYPMAELNYAQDTQDFRFHFKSRAIGNNSSEGWGIDGFDIYVPPQNSAAPMKVRTVRNLIFPGVKQDLRIVVENTGAKNLEKYKIQVRIADDNGNFIDLGTQDIVPSPIPLVTGARHTINFAYPWEAQDVTVGLHDVQVITSRPNDKQDNYTPDDTLYWQFTVLDTIDFRRNSGDTLYCNDFERDKGIAPWFATNADVYQDGNYSWEWGIPNQFGLAHSGTNSWATGTDVDYPVRDSSALITPIFLVDSGQALEMEFYYWIKSERFHDGGNVDVSFDGGITWQTLGWAWRDQDPRSDEWYNTEAVTSLDIIRPGWSGHTTNWKKARWRFSFDYNSQAIFRFRFASDYDIEDNGWAIDDFCIKHTQTSWQKIGTEEPEMPQENIATELSPNPSEDGISRLALYLPSPKEGSVVVVNSVGQLMESRDLKLNDGVNTIPFDGSQWDPGMYIIKLYLDDDIITRKWIIAR